jgi:hypothetical protein
MTDSLYSLTPRRIRSVILATTAMTANLVHADDFGPNPLTVSQTDFGGVGLMQMPTGRSGQDGDFNFGVTVSDDYQHIYASMQLLPWLETTIRYTRVPDVLYSTDESFSGDNIYTDKGIDFKIKLLNEGYWLPETAIGIRDFGGTGLFDGEFIAGTKRVGPLDFTLGLGWGYLGQSGNISSPTCQLAERFCTRDSSYSGTGGSFDVQRWFSGPTALFGGVEYQTPYEPLVLKVEYDGNDYSEDFPVVKGDKTMTQRTHWNVGAVHRLGDWGDLKVSYERGDIYVVGLDLNTNFNAIQSSWIDDSKPSYSQDGHPDSDWQKTSQRIAENAGYVNNKIIRDGKILVVSGEQTKYRDRKEAQERAALILHNTHTPNIDTYRIVEMKNGVPVIQTDIDQQLFSKVANNEYIEANIADATQIVEPSIPNGEPLSKDPQKWNAGIAPVLAQSIGGAETFYFYHFGFNTNASYWLSNNVEASGSIYFNLDDNYDKYNYVGYSPTIDNFSVPRVRTLFRSYVHDNPIRMNRLQLTWFAQPSTNLYSQAYAGYLEMMFAGVGGELLYRPLNASWALGVDANLVSQRDPDSWFGTYSEPYYFFDENECSDLTTTCAAYVLDQGTTGQVTAYYQPRWGFIENSLFKLSAGKFLGGDVGARLDISRQFDSGVIVGAYATLTDLSAEEYGEGSFNKGFYVNIPFDVLTVKPSTNRAIIAWQPITRDGGQTLSRKYELYNVTDARSPWFERPGSF